MNSSINGFGERLRQLRKKRHQVQADIARVCGVSREAVSQWENGKADPSCANLIAIVVHYEYCYKWLLEGKGHMSLEEVRRQLRYIESKTGARLQLDEMVRIKLDETPKTYLLDLKKRIALNNSFSPEERNFILDAVKAHGGGDGLDVT